jgi:hypothetical protein
MSKSPAEVGKELFEKEEQKDREVAKKFSPQKILEDAKAIRVLNDPVLGEVKYTVLTTGDLLAMNKITDEWERARSTIFRLLHKAYPELKEEKDVDNFPGHVTTRLCELIADPENFFQIPQASTNGSQSTKKRKSSA